MVLLQGNAGNDTLNFEAEIKSSTVRGGAGNDYVETDTEAVTVPPSPVTRAVTLLISTALLRHLCLRW